LLPDRLPTSVSIGQHCPIVAYRLQMKADGAVHESRFWSFGPGISQSGDMAPYKTLEKLWFDAFPQLHYQFRLSCMPDCYCESAQGQD
ncbi:MAG: hypothetical protein R2832_15975, partial [Rhodothermales bacterium]